MENNDRGSVTPKDRMIAVETVLNEYEEGLGLPKFNEQYGEAEVTGYFLWIGDQWRS